MRIFDNWVGGQWVPPEGGRYMGTDNPYTGKTWARIARSGAADVDRAVAAARAALEEGPWGRLTVVERASILRRLGDLVRDNFEMLAKAETIDNGKTITEMRVQMRNVAEWYYYYAGLVDKASGEFLPTERRNHLNYTCYEPLGVVALITPWNSPVRLLAWKLAPALAAGNVAVIKPSEFASTSTLIFCELAGAAGIPPGVINAVTGLSSEAGEALVTHPHVAKIAFTGGPVGGAKIYEAAARDFKSVTLELGGKSPNIVFEDADIGRAALGAATAIFGSYGQSCVAGSRLLVHEDVHDEIVGRIVEIAKSIRFGDPMDPDIDVGPIANRPQYEKILRYVEIAQSQGAKVVCGGRPMEVGGGLFIEPAVVTGVTNDMRIAQEEVFGPVMSVIPFRDEAEAIQIANDSKYGLAAGIWTTNVNRAHRVAARLKAGSVWINTYRITSQLSPFGGYKSSGVGREGGAEALRSYMQVKSVWLDMNETFTSPFKAVPAA